MPVEPEQKQPELQTLCRSTEWLLSKGGTNGAMLLH